MFLMSFSIKINDDDFCYFCKNDDDDDDVILFKQNRSNIK